MLCLTDIILWGRDMDITKSLLSILDACEMWVYRRVLKIAWTEKVYQRGSEKDENKQRNSAAI